MERPTLTDGVVTLRPGRTADADDLTVACQDPESQRWSLVLPSPYRRADAVAFIARSAEDAVAGRAHHFVVVEASEDRALGSFSAMGRELGYLLAPDARGRGVATRALILLRDWAHDTLGHDRLELLIHPDNARSRAVAERAGFLDSGQRRTPPRGRNPSAHAVYVWRAAPSAA